MTIPEKPEGLDIRWAPGGDPEFGWRLGGFLLVLAMVAIMFLGLAQETDAWPLGLVATALACFLAYRIGLSVGRAQYFSLWAAMAVKNARMRLAWFCSNSIRLAAGVLGFVMYIILMYWARSASLA
jgi:hypothetical protein